MALRLVDEREEMFQKTNEAKYALHVFFCQGGHPTVAEGEVARVVNFDYSGNPERWSIDVSVVNCGEFYLYNLKDVPSCSLGYCGQSGGFTTVET